MFGEDKRGVSRSKRPQISIRVGRESDTMQLYLDQVRRRRSALFMNNADITWGSDFNLHLRNQTARLLRCRVEERLGIDRVRARSVLPAPPRHSIVPIFRLRVFEDNCDDRGNRQGHDHG
jgi:hypothetical protein